MDVLRTLGAKEKDGLVQTQAGRYQTSNPKVFAAGEIASGGSSIVGSMASGMKAAREAYAWLEQEGITLG
jgi:glutamate synthase (NADPH/NADH) small chain